MTTSAQRQQDRIAEVHTLHQQGWTNKAIAAHLELHPKIVRRHLVRPVTWVPQRHRRRRALAHFAPYLRERWYAGCHNATQLWREIRAAGFSGGRTVVREFVQPLRQASPSPAGCSTMMRRFGPP